MYLFLVLMTALALSLSIKNKHRFMSFLIVGYFIAYIIFDLPIGQLVNYLYLSFLIIRNIFFKKRNSQPLNTISY